MVRCSAACCRWYWPTSTIRSLRRTVSTTHIWWSPSRPAHHSCAGSGRTGRSPRGSSCTTGSDRVGGCLAIAGAAVVVRPWWSRPFDHTLLVTLSWSHSPGHTLLITLSWSHSPGHILLVTLSWSHSLDHTLLITHRPG